jgi:hypothetical protein
VNGESLKSFNRSPSANSFKANVGIRVQGPGIRIKNYVCNQCTTFMFEVETLKISLYSVLCRLSSEC